MFTICLHGTFENKTFLKAVLGTDVTPTVSATPEKVTGKLVPFTSKWYIAKLDEQAAATFAEQEKQALSSWAITGSPNSFYGNALGTIRTGGRGGTAPSTIAIIGGDDEYLQQVDFINAHS